MVALPLAIQLANVELAHQRPPFFILVPPAAVGHLLFFPKNAIRIAGRAANLPVRHLAASKIEENRLQTTRSVVVQFWGDFRSLICQVVPRPSTPGY